MADPYALLLLDWPGNNRLDSRENILNDNRVRLLLVISRIKNVIRAKGSARICDELELGSRLGKKRKPTETVFAISVVE